jgi:hypothetical protein
LGKNNQMNHSTNRIARLLRASCIGAVLGVVAAIAGLAVEGWNVDHHGAEYSSYRFHYIGLGAFPGVIIAENRFGADFRLGEVMQHKTTVIGWNAFAYSLLSAGVFALFSRSVAPPPPSTLTKKEAQQGAP